MFPFAMCIPALVGAAEPIECTAVTDNVVFPTFHVMNNITRVNGVLQRERLNDANASTFLFPFIEK